MVVEGERRCSTSHYIGVERVSSGLSRAVGRGRGAEQRESMLALALLQGVQKFPVGEQRERERDRHT